MDSVHESLNEIFRKIEAHPHHSHGGKRPFYNRHAPTVDTDEDDEEEEALRSMLLAGHVSDQSSDDDDHHDHPVQPKKTVRFRTTRHHAEEGLRPEDEDDDLDDEDLPDAPDWFLWQSFQHSRVVAAPFLAGGILPVMLGGDLLIGVITLGILVTHLWHEGGSTKRASASCILTTVCAAIVVVFNVSPHVIWTSPVYLLLLVPAFVFTLLSGVWPLLMIKDFCRREPDTAYFLESLLFTLYPVCAIILVTWSVSMVISIRFTPYVLLITGFLFFRLFLQPTFSSFVKPDWWDDSQKLVVDAASATVLTIGLVLLPTLLHFILILGATQSSLVIAGSFFEGITILLTCIFLVTFLHIQIVCEHTGISKETVLLTRKIVSIAIIIAGNMAVHCHGYQSLLLPWWPLVFLFTWAGQGYNLSRNNKSHSLFFTANLLVLCVLVILNMPWNLVYYVGGGLWSVQFMYVLVFINAALSIGCVYASKFCPCEVFSPLILLHSIVFSPLQSALQENNLKLSSAVISLHIFCSYVIIKLHLHKKLLWQHFVLSTSIHITGAVSALDVVFMSTKQAWPWYIITYITLYVLIVLILYTLTTDTNQAFDAQKFVKYISSVGVSSFIHLWISNHGFLASFIVEGSSAFSYKLGLSCVVAGLAGMKLLFSHAVTFDLARSLTTVLFVLGSSLTVLQPELSIQWHTVVRWLLLVCVVCGSLLVILLTRVRSLCTLYALCMLTGMSAGSVVYTLMSPVGAPTSGVYMLLLGAQISLGLSMFITVYKQMAKMEHHLFILGLSLTVLSMLSSVGDLLTTDMTAQGRSPGSLAAGAGFIVVAAIIKTQSFNQLPQVSRDRHKKSQLPLLCNVATLAGFTSFSLLRPYHLVPQELWLLACSSICFLLRKDNVPILRNLNHRNHVTPTIVVISSLLVSHLVYHSPLWLPIRHFSVLFFAVMEMAAIILTLPVVVTLWIVLWYGDFHHVGSYTCRAQALSVLYLMPFFLGFLLMPISTTYHAWVYGAIGLGVGTWLWKTKIPLTLM